MPVSTIFTKLFSYVLYFLLSIKMKTVGSTKNGKSTETGNIGYKTQNETNKTQP